MTLRGLPSAVIGYGAPTAATSCRRPTNYQAGWVPVSNHSDGFPPQTDESLSPVVAAVLAAAGRLLPVIELQKGRFKMRTGP